MLLAVPTGECWNKGLNINITFLSSLLLPLPAFPIFPSRHCVSEIPLLLLQRKEHGKIWTSVLPQLGSLENDIFPSVFSVQNIKIRRQIQSHLKLNHIKSRIGLKFVKSITPSKMQNFNLDYMCQVLLIAQYF